MILSAHSLRVPFISSVTGEYRKIVEPFREKYTKNGFSGGLSSAGYDVSIAQTIWLMPHGFRLASTVEHFELPSNVMGKVADKSSWVRRGICAQNSTIEPGWRGFLTLELTNHTWKPVKILVGTPIAQIIFHYLDTPTELYTGKYQDQPNVPVGWLR